jgi:diguanylate cyclase (GGDEF)-like protein/PAS domain S-box-containing protein
MSPIRIRFPLRGLSLLVFAVLVGGTLTASGYARRVVREQERRLLVQRAGEAAALLTNLTNQAQATTKSLVAVALATHGEPEAFTVAAGRDPAVASGSGGAALVREEAGRYRVVAASGAGPTPGQELSGEAATVVGRARHGDQFVTTPVFASGAVGERRIGFALRVDGTPDSPVIYRETTIRPPGERRQITSTEAFSEIEAVLYATPGADADQAVLATRALPIPGRTVKRSVAVGADRWLLVVAANRPLVGTMATNEPWRLLARGFFAAILVTALVEVLRRRRGYALALVDERTAVLKQQADELVRDRERLAEAQRIAHIGSWEWDVEPDALTWSEELHRIFGVDPERFEPTYSQYLARVHDEDRALVKAGITACYENRQPFVFDHRVLRPDGEIRWLSCEGLAEVDESGTLVRLRGTAQDITGRRRVEEQFRDLLETAPDGIVIVDGDGRIVLVNRQTETLFGWSRDQLIGRSVELLLPERFAHRHQMHREAYSADLELRPMGADLDLYALRADGTEFPVEISLSPLRTDQGVLVSAAVRDVSDRKQAQLQLAHQAVHDALTGLPNRVLVGQRLEQALARSVRMGSEVAVLFVDLDRFKLINDSRGHAAGDELLVTVAERLRGVVRTDDVVARFGGDEFVVVCEDQRAAFEASLVAERIMEVLKEPVLVDGQEIFLSASVGIAVTDGTGSPDSLLRDADAAMYRAKEKGRARSEYFDATMRTEAIEHLETQSALHRAIERDELRVFYQPVVDLASGVVTGMEALVRWEHPQLGLVSPASFIPLAEETGLIVPIGAWVLEQATAQLTRWRAQRWGQHLTMNVNLAARQLRQPDLIPALMSSLLDRGLEPGALCLELTETTFMEDVGSHRETLAAIQALGVGLAIDDFGTGYSSLTYLKRFPVSVLKIDQAFVRGLGEDAADTAIVKSVIDLAHALGLVVVAEGVETADQVAHLLRLGCDLAQGYFFARPQSADNMEAIIAGMYRAAPSPGTTPSRPAATTSS